jgi:hypothetical protein
VAQIVCLESTKKKKNNMLKLMLFKKSFKNPLTSFVNDELFGRIDVLDDTCRERIVYTLDAVNVYGAAVV